MVNLDKDKYVNIVLLTADNVAKIIGDCFFTQEELNSYDDGIPNEAILVEGITIRPGFNPERLYQYKSAVLDMLSYLPNEFFENEGGGWSFLNMVTRKNDSQWGEQRDAEALLCLGLAMDLIKPLVPKEMWQMFPGGVPYITVRELP